LHRLLCNEVFNGVDLSVNIGLGMHPDRKEREIAPLCDMLYRSLLHIFEELICERLHYETNHRLLFFRSKAGVNAWD